MKEEIKKLVEMYAEKRMKEIKEASEAVSKFQKDLENIKDMFIKSAENLKKIDSGTVLVVDVNGIRNREVVIGDDKLYSGDISIRRSSYGLETLKITINVDGTQKEYLLPDENYDFFLVVKKREVNRSGKA